MNKIIYGYKPTNITCPICGANYGMLEQTDDPNVFLYTCWCGATVKGREDDNERSTGDTQ